MKLNYIAKSYDQDKKLKDILKKRLYISTELLKKLKYSNCIFVNNIIKENDLVTVDLEKYLNIKDTPKFEDKFILKDAPLDILYEDEYLLIVNKPEKNCCDSGRIRGVFRLWIREKRHQRLYQ